MMIDTIRSQLFHLSLHTSWSLTSGKMNGSPISGTAEVVFPYGHVKALVEKKEKYDTEETAD